MALGTPNPNPTPNPEPASSANVEYRDVSIFLKNHFTQLQKKNPSLSLRSVARRIQVSPSYLSKIVNGHQRLPPNLLAPLGEALQLDHLLLKNLQSMIIREIEQNFLQSSTGISALDSESKSDKQDSKREDSHSVHLTDYSHLNRKQYWMLEKWYYLAIVNLTTVDDFDSSATWISKRLGISESVASSAVTKLKQAGVLAVDELGQLKQTSRKIRFPTSKSHSAVRDYHAAHLKKALQILDRADLKAEEEFKSRLISGISFAGDKKKLETAKVMIHEAMYKVAEYLAGEQEVNEVFHLAIQLFPVTVKVK